jgi:Protein of unknown function (DUF418)
LIYGYLLARDAGKCWHQQKMIKKGMKRVFELYLWGYVLQLNLKVLIQDGWLAMSSWLQAFHVLHAIGTAIALCLLIHVICHWLKASDWFGVVMLILGLILNWASFWLPTDHYVPLHAPEWLQNMIHGKYSVFPVSPWLSFSCYGAGLGHLLQRYQQQFTTPSKMVKVSSWLMLVAIILILGGGYIDQAAARFFKMSHKVTIQDWHHHHLGMVLAFLVVLFAWEKISCWRALTFCAIGQNTLVIYIIHSILLYGSFTGFGLDQFVSIQLSAWQVIVAMLMFVVVTLYLSQLWVKEIKKWRAS